MPAALAFCARRQIEFSTSFGVSIMRSLSSSMKITICRMYCTSGFLSDILLNPLMSRTENVENSLYLFSISPTAHASEPPAFLGSEITGTSRCGMPLYTENSTCLGSIINSLTSSQVALKRILVIIEFKQTDLPEPVVPAMSK